MSKDFNVTVRKPCVEPGCPNLSLGGRRGHRCRPCQIAYTNVKNRQKPSAYRDPAYRAVRASGLLFSAGTATPCWICGLPGATTVDHVVPLAHGGTNEISNLRPAHHTCNSGKQSRDVTSEGDDKLLGITRITHDASHDARGDASKVQRVRRRNTRR